MRMQVLTVVSSASLFIKLNRSRFRLLSLFGKGNVLNKIAHVEGDTVFHTLASLDILSYFDPVFDSKVNSFGNVEPMIKASMVA